MDPMTNPDDAVDPNAESEIPMTRRWNDGSPPYETRRKRSSAVVDAITTPVPFWVIGILIVLGGLVALALDAQRRDAAEQSTLQALYLADLRDYDNALRDRADCIEAVGRSDLNRGQHEANRDAFDKLFTVVLPRVFGFGEETIAGLHEASDELVADLNAGPLLSSEPRKITECPDAPEPPTPPAGLDDEGPLPTLVTDDA